MTKPTRLTKPVKPTLAAMCLFAAALPTALPVSAQAQEAPLIPRELFFGNPDRAGTQISPDGKRISYLAPVDGVLNIWVAPANNIKAAKAVTSDKTRGIHQYNWTFDGKHLIYLQDTGGDENDHVYRVDPASGEVKDLTPIAGVKAQINSVSHRHPNEILVGLNDRNKQLHDLYKINLSTGERTLVFKNDRFVGLLADDDFRLRAGFAFGPDFKLRVMKTVDGKTFEPLITVDSEDILTTNPVGFDKSGDNLYIIDSRGRDKSALTRVNLSTLKTDVIAEGTKADVSGIMVHPTENTVQAVSTNYDKVTWQFLDPAVKADFDVLKKVSSGEVSVSSRTLDDRKWIVGFVRDDGPSRAYLYDRDTKKASFLYVNRTALDGKKLAKMQPIVIKSRDGLDLVSYLTIPAGVETGPTSLPTKPLPMVLLVHGGPWARDNWGFNGLHQWLANRGYAVLSVNYRGSTGYGKKFINAANREWAGKMHDDLIDAVDFSVANGITDPRRVAIMGGSYGGYSTLVGLTFTPDKFAAGVDIVGPSSLVTLMKNVPPYWVPIMPVMNQRVGDVSTEQGRKFLMERSPLSRVDRIERPLLIGQGANDPRVNQVEADQIVKAMKEKNLPVTYVLYPDEGHGFQRPENNLSFFAVTEQFLNRYLGGRAEPIGSAFKGSSIQVPEGSGNISGLQEALKEKK